MSGIKPFAPFKKVGTSITPKVSTDTIKLLNPNAVALSLGSATEEGGDINIYRDTSANLQIYINADAASNEIALSIYGGVVAQNYLTVGQAALDTSYPLYVNGQAFCTGAITSSGGGGVLGQMFSNPVSNAATLPIRINVSGTNATDHKISLQINTNDIIAAQATGNGAGGIIGKRAIITGGLAVSKVDAGAADYNPSILTSDYIISVDTTAAARAVTISAEDKATGSATSPRIFIIKDIAGNASVNNITVSLETAGTIDGAATAVINGDYNSITLMTDGTNAYII